MARRPRLLGTLLCALTGTIGGAIAIASTPSCTVFSGVVFDGGTAGGGGNAASTSGSGAGGQPPDTLHYLSLEDGARFCALLAECPEPALYDSVTEAIAVPMDASNYSLCLTWVSGPIPGDRIGFSYQQKTLACMVKAKDCESAAACNPREEFAGNDPRCAGKLDAGADAGGQECESSNTVIRCDNGGDSLHCDNPYYAKSSCLVDADGSKWCASGTGCSMDTQCLGSVLNYCGSMSILQFSVDCSTLGLTCGADRKSGYVDCLTDGVDDICGDTTKGQLPDKATHCNGKTLLYCANGWLSPFHCDAVGGDCDKTHGPTAFCTGPTNVCSPYDADVNKCDGSKAVVCVGGQKQSFDCKSIGKTCAQSPAFGCH